MTKMYKIITQSGVIINTPNYATAENFSHDGATVSSDEGKVIFPNTDNYIVPSDPALDNNCESCQ